MSAPAFEIFFDGDCPLCRREIDMTRKLDRRGAVRFTDIAAPGFKSEALGLPPEIDHPELMARIHGRYADGTLVEGVEVFRALYTALGFRRLVGLTRLRPIAWALDRGYAWFARNRLSLTGRCDAQTCATP